MKKAMQKKKKKNNFKENIIRILNSYKTIILISILINIVLLLFSYYTISNNSVYTFSGEDEYLSVKDGIVIVNSDINLLNGNNVKYIYNEDYKIIEYKIGYYLMDGDKLIELVSTDLKLESKIKISEIVNNFTSFNLLEKSKNEVIFTKANKKLLDKNGLYLILDAKTEDDINIYSKLKLNVSKVSNF